MNQNHIIAYEYLSQAQQALKKGDRKSAQEFCDLAMQTAPDLEEVWLLQASLSQPNESLQYLKHALLINPQSERAKRGMEWARNRLQQMGMEEPRAEFNSARDEVDEAPEPVVEIPQQAVERGPNVQLRVRTRSWITVVSVLLLIAVIAIGWYYRDDLRSALAGLAGQESGDSTWVEVDPAITPVATIPDADGSNTSGSKQLPIATNTLLPSATVESTATDTPMPPTATDLPVATSTVTPELVTVTPDPALVGVPSPTPLPTDTDEPGFIPYATPVESGYEAPAPNISGGDRWIDINLSQQMVYAYEGDQLVNSFVASTGTWEYPTVTGQYNVYVKYPYTDMSGVDYYLADVPNTMYFYKGYAIHGTYWHSNFGTPMSHGCVNLSIPDSAWVFEFATVGTLVNVHY